MMDLVDFKRFIQMQLYKYIHLSSLLHYMLLQSIHTEKLQLN